MVHSTPFPVTPADVVALTTQEFTFDVDVNDGPSLDMVCARFLDDTNRALVWFIRFRALKAWSTRAEIASWFLSDAGNSRGACEVAASFRLNAEWQFDPEEFRLAVDSLVGRRSRYRRR